jgi:hypothetical protein
MRPILVLLPPSEAVEVMLVVIVKSPEIAMPANAMASSPLHMCAPLPINV